jgi:hypothetical protein
MVRKIPKISEHHDSESPLTRKDKFRKSIRHYRQAIETRLHVLS